LWVSHCDTRNQYPTQKPIVHHRPTGQTLSPSTQSNTTLQILRWFGGEENTIRQMKKAILLLFFLPCIAFGQTTAIPDIQFEWNLINMGYDTGTPDGSVPTANIDTVTYLSVWNKNISDLTGIEDFTALITLGCNNNQITSLDVSNNTALEDLDCRHNLLTTLVVNNPQLELLYCDDNLLASLDVSQCLDLEQLRASNNKLTSLDLSQNINFDDELYLSHNELTSLNIKNGMNYLISNNQFTTVNNPDLYCIEVDDPTYSNVNWSIVGTNIDAQHYFALSCATSVDDVENTNK